MSAHTPGPWFHDSNGNVWRRDPKDLYENGGTVAGDKPLATIYKGWHHDGAEGYPVEANARLIAAAPELLEALIDCRRALELAGATGELAVVDAAIDKALSPTPPADPLAASLPAPAGGAFSNEVTP